MTDSVDILATCVPKPTHMIYLVILNSTEKNMDFHYIIDFWSHKACTVAFI